jgi:hypothetical protein
MLWKEFKMMIKIWIWKNMLILTSLEKLRKLNPFIGLKHIQNTKDRDFQKGLQNVLFGFP